MGAMKRLYGYRLVGQHIPLELRILAGLVRPRGPVVVHHDPESAREVRAEREAIQWEANTDAKDAAAADAATAPGPLALRPPPTHRPPPAERRPAPDPAPARKRVAEKVEDSPGPPVAAARGFYRVGPSFYHVGQGPYPDFGKAPEPPPAPAPTAAKPRQLILF